MSGAELQFNTATKTWFDGAFASPTEVQRRGWPSIQERKHTLLFAPTGSGKTLAAFLSCIDHLMHERARIAHAAAAAAHTGRRKKRNDDDERGYRTVYISPLKALVYDVERNLKSPIIGIGNTAARLGEALAPVQVDIRTGDTPQNERQRMLRNPGDILVTTPESLYLMLTSGARENFRRVDQIIIDEIHVMAGSKRGVHLAVTLERLAALCSKDPQRIGLSATQRPLERIARYLGGYRHVEIIDAHGAPKMSLTITVPVSDMENPPLVAQKPPTDFQFPGHTGATSGASGAAAAEDATAPYVPSTEGGIWPNIYPRLLEQIKAHRSTIVFTNSRLLCERLARKLNELAGEELVKTHHGSISHDQRKHVEEALKAGQVPALVATSSLELGIDMGAVDLVILIESPGAVSRGLQRIGRAGHGVGEISNGIMFPKYRGDLLECAVVSRAMLEGEIEETSPPENCLDVLAQHIVAMVAMTSWTTKELLAFFRKTAPYTNLTVNVFEAVLDMLSGRYPSDEFADLTPRIVWDRTTGELTPRKNARMTAILNGGTIPDRGLYTVNIASDGKRLGELDEEMVFETRQGDTLILGASTWRVESITKDRVTVIPAPGQPGRLPFWRGERPGRPASLGRRMAKFLGEVEGLEPTALRAHLKDYAPMDDYAVQNLAAFIEEQKEVCGALPSDTSVTVERFQDELGDWRICILTPLGIKVHAPWALCLEAQLAGRAGFDVDVMYTDDGLALRLVEAETLPDTLDFFPSSEEVEALVTEQLAHSALFATRFRENAARALLLPRRRAGQRTPLWMQRRRAQTLLSVARQYSGFPMVLETYRECLRDVFDIEALKGFLGRLERREVRVHDIETKRASPFSRSLVFQYVANYLYDTDAPSAERKAQALALDHALLAELLGQEELRELLDEESVESVEAELNHTAPDRRAKSADQLHDVLRRLGELSEAELRLRTEGSLSTMLDALLTARRAIAVRVAGVECFIPVEDAARYRDALGVVLPPGLADTFLESSERPLESLIRRAARTRGPFLSETLADRWGLSNEVIVAILRKLEAEGDVVYGDIRPGGLRREWCDKEVLRRLKRRSLATLRKEVEPVDADVFARFLLGWHGIGLKRPGPDRLLDVVCQLEGLALSYTELTSRILPQRVAGFQPSGLDELGATGAIVWQGRGAISTKDGKIALLRRDRTHLLGGLGKLSDEEPERSDIQTALLGHLEARGASFFSELRGVAPSATQKELLDELWDLVWQGVVTNDTFAPLRGLAARSTRRRPKEIAMIGGRWSLLDTTADVSPEATTRDSHALCIALLERYGVLSREAVAKEGVPGGFARVYRVLRAMEDGGQVRRGRFVDGLSGAQFALPGAVDRLRQYRDSETERIEVLAATDPAQPYGALLPWPQSGESVPRPRRVPGASVVLVGGRPVLFLEQGKKSLIVFVAPDDVLLPRAIGALRGPRELRLQKVNGEASRQSPYAEALVSCGFAPDHRGLSLS